MKKVAIIVILLIIIFFTGYWIFKGSDESDNKNADMKQEESSKDEKQKEKMKMSYQHEIYNFIVKYPEGYEFFENNWEDKGEEQPGRVIYDLKLGNKSVSNIDNDTNKEIVVYVAKIDKKNPLKAPYGMDPKSEEETTIGGEKAMKYDGGKVYTVAKDKYEYLLVLGDEADDSIKSDFEKIVSDFRFLREFSDKNVSEE